MAWLCEYYTFYLARTDAQLIPGDFGTTNFLMMDFSMASEYVGENFFGERAARENDTRARKEIYFKLVEHQSQ